MAVAYQPPPDMLMTQPEEPVKFTHSTAGDPSGYNAPISAAPDTLTGAMKVDGFGDGSGTGVPPSVVNEKSVIST